LDQHQIAQAQATLTQLIEVAQEAHDDVRRYILGIRTSTRIPNVSQLAADAAGVAAQPPSDFFAALEDYLDVLRERYGLETHVSWPEDVLDSPLAPEVETQLLRIIQEALSNVRQHAGVSTAHLLFTFHADEMQVIIEDNGSGFDANGQISKLANQQAGKSADQQVGESVGERITDHFGLQIMRERAESVGGGLEVRSAPGEGTRVIVRMPRALVSFSGEEWGRGVRVLLVDDHPLYLEGLRSLFAARGIHVIGEAYDGLEALDMARALHPDLILMDVHMPRCGGVEATRRIKAELPDVRIVILTMAADGDTLFEALKGGASGYLLKSLDGAQFFSLLTKAMEGETVLSPALAARMLAEFARREIEPGSTEGEMEPEDRVPAHPERDRRTRPEQGRRALTVRQREVLELVAQGLTNKEIADALYVSEATVKYHVSQVLERLYLQSRHQLARYAQEHGPAPPLDDEQPPNHVTDEALSYSVASA
jgi:DNA-binding NarL/FixJ family response regulator/anti-sigma regulatory factor (Ser/Thr protein kinase)